MEKGFFRSISLIHTSLLLGQLMFLAVTIYLIGGYSIKADIANDYSLIIVPAVALFAFYVGNMLYQKRISNVHKDDELSDRLITVRSGIIIRLALLEGATLLAIVMYFLSGNFLYVIVAVILMIYFYTLKPTKEQLQESAALSTSEVEMI